MDKVIRQDEPVFKTFLEHMRDGEMSKDDISFIIAHCKEKLSPEEQERFRHAINFVPTWAKANEIFFDYIQDQLTTPVAKLTATINTKNLRQCLEKESNIPTRNALCVGMKVMLLKNFVVEHGLFNGAIGQIVQLVFPHKDGQQKNETLGYAIVDFTHSTIPENEKLIPDMPRTCVPVPITHVICEKGCCSMHAFPVRCSVAITGHKSQGMTVAEGEPYEV